MGRNGKAYGGRAAESKAPAAKPLTTAGCSQSRRVYRNKVWKPGGRSLQVDGEFPRSAIV